MVNPKPTLTIVTTVEVLDQEPPYALECARSWGYVAGVCIVASALLSFVPETWARPWAVIADLVALLSVIAVLSLFRDHVNGEPILLEGDEDDE